MQCRRNFSIRTTYISLSVILGRKIKSDGIVWEKQTMSNRSIVCGMKERRCLAPRRLLHGGRSFYCPDTVFHIGYSLFVIRTPSIGCGGNENEVSAEVSRIYGEREFCCGKKSIDYKDCGYPELQIVVDRRRFRSILAISRAVIVQGQ
jgi:hypothetical protein